jgi:hypothetical protein
MGEVYVYRDGQLVPKSDAGRRTSGPQVISDTMPGMVHPCNGKMYDSKSRFRAETRARNCVEVGNETMRDTRRVELPPLKADIARAIRELGG